MNYIENMHTIVVTTLIAGWMYPQFVIYTSFILAFGRFIYMVGYVIAPNKRFLGFGIFMFCNMFHMILSLSACFLIMGGDKA